MTDDTAATPASEAPQRELTLDEQKRAATARAAVRWNQHDEIAEMNAPLCSVPGCRRKPEPTNKGWLFARCPMHVSLLLTGAFRSPDSPPSPTCGCLYVSPSDLPNSGPEHRPSSPPPMAAPRLGLAVRGRRATAGTRGT